MAKKPSNPTPKVVASTPAEPAPPGRVRPSGFLSVDAPAKAPKAENGAPEAPAEPEKTPQEASYDRLFESAKKFVASRKAEAEGTSAEPSQPVAQPAAEPAPPPALPPQLLERARELGWTEAETLAIGDAAAVERQVDTAERMLLKTLKSQQGVRHEADKPKQEPPKPAGPPSIWRDEAEKKLYDPQFVELVERMNANLHQHYQGKIGEVEAQLQQARAYLAQQEQERGQSQIDQLTDKLADKGYMAEFGKGRSASGTPQAANKSKFANLIAAEYRAYAEQGLTLDLDEAAAIIAKRVWGARQASAPAEKPAAPERTTQFTIKQPTTTARPTQREARDQPKGREAAIAAARGFYEANGNPLADIHGED